MSAAFDAVFGVFVALVLALAVISVRWALRRDRAERAARAARAGPGESNGRVRPRPDAVGEDGGRPVAPRPGKRVGATPPSPPASTS